MSDPFVQLRTATDSSANEPAASFAEQLRRRVDDVTAGTDAAPRRWHLAQLNLGLFKESLDHPDMAPFVAGLDRINEMAELSPGFVWRLKDEDGNSSSFVEVPGAMDPLTASNLTVWEDLESLWNFVYKTDLAFARPHLVGLSRISFLQSSLGRGLRPSTFKSGAPGH